MTPLDEKQIFFLCTIAYFILDAKAAGYLLTAGEFYRPPEMAAIYAKEGKGIVHSNHVNRLAADLNAFKDGAFVEYSVDNFEPLGKMWESYSTRDFTCKWGGRFKKPDCDHFSVENDGVE